MPAVYRRYDPLIFAYRPGSPAPVGQAGETDKTAMDFRRLLPEIRWQSCLSPGYPVALSHSSCWLNLAITARSSNVLLLLTSKLLQVFRAFLQNDRLFPLDQFPDLLNDIRIGQGGDVPGRHAVRNG